MEFGEAVPALPRRPDSVRLTLPRVDFSTFSLLLLSFDDAMDWLDDTAVRLPSSTMGSGPLMEEVIVGMKGFVCCSLFFGGVRNGMSVARWLVTQRICFFAAARKYLLLLFYTCRYKNSIIESCTIY